MLYYLMLRPHHGLLRETVRLLLRSSLGFKFWFGTILGAYMMSISTNYTPSI